MSIQNKEVRMKRTIFTYKLARLLNRPLFPPEMLILSLTTRCNFRCVYCNIRKDSKKEDELKTHEIYSILDQAKDMGIETLVLSGGEPFVREDVFDIINYANSLGFNVNVGSNGVFGAGIIKRIIASGVKHLHFSLDGFKNTNDRLRKKSSFDIIIQNIKLLKKSNPDLSLGIGTVVTSKNCDELFEMTLLADELKIDTMNFIPFLTDNSNPKDNKKAGEFWPNDENIKALKNNLKQIANHNYNTLHIDKTPNFEHLVRYYEKKKVDNECYSGYKSMIVTCPSAGSTSQVFFCQGECGDSLKEGLKNVWLSKKAKKIRKDAKKCNNICLQLCHFIK